MALSITKLPYLSHISFTLPGITSHLLHHSSLSFFFSLSISHLCFGSLLSCHFPQKLFLDSPPCWKQVLSCPFSNSMLLLLLVPSSPPPLSHHKLINPVKARTMTFTQCLVHRVDTQWIHSCIYTLNKYLLNIHSVPGTGVEQWTKWISCPSSFLGEGKIFFNQVNKNTQDG